MTWFGVLSTSTTVLACLGAILYLWTKWRFSYWSKKGLESPPFKKNLFCHLEDILKHKQSYADACFSWYNYFKKRNLDHGGIYLIFGRPFYFPVDIKIIRSIMQNDFKHFVDRGLYYNEKVDPISAHIFYLEGKKWKDVRAKMSPAFTSGQLKMMFETILDCTKSLYEVIDNSLEQSVEMSDVLARFTTDVVGTCAFGIECNALKNPHSEFWRMGKKIFQLSLWENIVHLCSFVAPDFMRCLGVREINRDVSNFFRKAVAETVAYREKNNVYRKDFMHLLIQLKNGGKLTDEPTVLLNKDKNATDFLTLDEIAAQAFVIYAGGFETSSSVMTFCCYELASNPEIQTKLRKEIKETYNRCDGHLTYTAVNEMPYLDQVLSESLRKYPPLPLVNRICTEDYVVPGTNVKITKGTKLCIPICAVQNDDRYFPNPQKFDPDRFLNENKDSNNFIAYIPFGEGPRYCIGARFGMMLTKIGISVILKNYELSLSPKTSLPIRLDPSIFVMSVKGGMWVDCKKI